MQTDEQSAEAHYDLALALDKAGDPQAAIYALEKADLFNLLVIQPYSESADVGNTVWTAGVAYCTERRALALVDPPYNSSGWDAAAT